MGAYPGHYGIHLLQQQRYSINPAMTAATIMMTILPPMTHGKMIANRLLSVGDSPVNIYSYYNYSFI